MTPEQFEEKFGRYGAQWLDPDKKTQARIGNYVRVENNKRVPHRIVQGKLPVDETLAHFTNGKLSRVQFSVYNRGDSGTVSRDAFEKLVADTEAALTAKTGKKPSEREKTRSAVKLRGHVWADDATNYLMEYSFERETSRQKFRPEFIRLVLVPKPEKEERKPLGSSGGPALTTVARSALAANVKKGDNGDVYIEGVPMVDQGQKGYCAVATTERVLRYYQIPVDQHEIAQASDASANGTNPMAMAEALRKLQSRFKYRLKEIAPYSPKEFQDTVRDYNRSARSAKKEAIDLNQHFSMSSVYAAMDPEVLKTAKNKPANVSKFMKHVHAFIDAGVPIMWGVTLGIFKESDIPQSAGGHMRLIIGYNETEKEILYSDSWGAGHELKRMPLDQAITITDGLYAIEPTLK